MPAAQIQFSQGGNTPAAGQSALGFLTTSPVTLFDAAGGGATSWAWSIVGFPGPLGSVPVITGASSQTATVTPPTDGIYIVKLVRVDGIVTTTDVRFFGVADLDYGHYLPSAGMTGNMTNIGGSTAAQQAGWEGRQDATTNVFLDAILRFLRGSVGRFVGKVATVNFSSGTPTTVTLVDGTDKPYRILNLTGSGLYTQELSTAGASEGKRFKFTVNLTAGAGGFTLVNGIGGSTLFALTAPPSGTHAWSFEAVFDGTNWTVHRISAVDPKAIPGTMEIPIVTGLQATSQIVYTRIGNLRIDPSKFPANTQITFQAIVEATAGKTAQILLYNLTDGGPVAGTPLSSSSVTPAVVSATVTLPGSQKDYEVQLLMTTAGTSSDHVDCTSAKLILTWA